mmetsp:Transcript_42798/g.69849  ORF Transcript_42798/g.69849 Transcript_42798/m.69849 type:complete len:209 (+) Transcript_42798:271-897(+)
MKDLGHQGALGLEVAAGEIHRQLDEVGDAGGVGRRNTREIGRHVRHHDIHRPTGQRGLQGCQHLILLEIPLDELHALDGFKVQQVQRDDGAIELANGGTALPGILGRELAPQVLAPGARRGTEVDDHLPGPDQLELLVDLLELVGSARAVAFFLRELHIGVVDMVVQPRLVDLLALGLGFHSVFQPARAPTSRPATLASRRRASRPLG